MKKRYMFTLTAERVEKFRALVKEVGLPPATLSNAIDDFVRDMTEVMESAKQRGSFTIRDIFTAMGKQVELILQEESNVREKRQKEKAQGK